MNDEKHTWQTIRKLLFINIPKEQNIFRINSMEITDSKEIANVFNNFFSNVSQNVISGKLLNVQERRIFNDFYFEEIAETQVEKYVNNLKTDCSQGLDHISSKFIKTHNETIVPVLTKLINNVTVRSANEMNDLNIAKVVPIFKNSEPDDIVNYRPISILPVLSKVFERNIHDQLFNERLVKKSFCKQSICLSTEVWYYISMYKPNF